MLPGARLDEDPPAHRAGELPPAVDGDELPPRRRLLLRPGELPEDDAVPGEQQVRPRLGPRLGVRLAGAQQRPAAG